MARFLLLVLSFLCLRDVLASEDASDEDVKELFNSTQIKINGKTYFFQLRKDGNGNDTTYKTVRDYLNNLEKVDDVEFILQAQNRKIRPSPFENLKNRRREYLKEERGSLGYSPQFLDDEWKYNLNNPFIEIPDIAHQLYKATLDKSNNKPHNVSTIRLLFETATNSEEIIKFNLNTLRNKTNEILIDAELRIYRLSEDNDTENEGKYASDQVIRLYQILPTNDTEEVKHNPDVHKLVSVIYVSSQYSGWQVFKVKNVLENWLNGDENIGFLLSATDSWENSVPVDMGHRFDGKYQPVLVVYLNSINQRDRVTSSALTPDPKQVERYINWSKNSNILPTNPMPCGRHVWYISFQELGWNNFIISPSGFMAFRCKGSCTSPLTSPFTNHGRLINAYHMSFSYLKRSCCVPDTYKAIPIMFYDKYQNVVIKTYDDMIVENCACR